MLKKLLSVLLATTVVLTSLLSAIMLTVSADTLSAGVYPYATNGVKTPIITHKTGEEATAFNDFFAKQTIDSLTDENYFNTFKPYGHLVKDEVVSNKTLISASLDSYSDSADNVYGSAGKSYKATYIKATNSSIKPANFDTAQNFHYVRVTNTMIISSDCKDTASVGFWVKSTHQTFIVVRLSANTNGTESFIISDRFLIPAGESFVEIPLSNFVTANSGYHPLREATGDIRIYNTDIFFKSTESFEGTRDIWFDNIGYYNYASKTDKALHSSDAILKNNVENYIQDGTAVKKDGVTWNADSKGSITVSNPISGTANLNAYNGNGQSIHYSTTQASTTAYNRFRNNGKVNTNNADGDPTGVNATLAVWIKTDRAIKIFLTADDSTVANSGRNRYQSSEYFLPAGETMLEIPVSDFDTQYVIANQTVDNQFVWDYLGCINFYFKSAVNNGNPNANVWVDSIAIIPGQIEDIPESSEESSSAESSSEESSSAESSSEESSSSEDMPVSSEPSPIIPDNKVTHGEGFVEVTLKPENWVNKKTETSAFEFDTNAAYSHASDKSAYKLTYSNISSTVNLINFYYNSRIYINGTAPYIFDEDSVFSFWVRADQPMAISVTYMDHDNVSNAQTQNGLKTINIPAGESIVRINMAEMTKAGCEFDYRYLFQLQFKINSTEDSYKTSGEIYFDSFGFYDADPTNNIPPAPELPEVPDTKVAHTKDFFEATLKNDKWVNKKTETSTFALDENAVYSHGSDKSAYKLSYSNISATENLINFYYDEKLYINGIAPYIYDEDSVLSFWMRADQPVTLRITYLDYNNLTDKYAQSLIRTVNVPAGESIVKIDMKDMCPDGVSYDYRYVYQLQIQVRANEESYKTSGEIYFDSFGFYDADPTNNIPPAPELPEVPDTKVAHTKDFFEATLKNDKWVNKKTETSTFALDENAVYSHGSDKSAYKLSYSNISATENLINFYYDEKLYINGIAPYIYDEDSVLSFWMRADQPVTLRITYLDYNNLTDKYAQSLIRTVNVPAGESIVKIDMKDMCPDGVSYDYRYAYQLQIQVRANEKSYKTSGEIYFDSFGFYDMNPSNEIPPKPQAPEIPDTKVTHDVGFVEIEPDAEMWMTKKADDVVISLADSSTRYHSGKTNVADNSSALKISYKNLSASMKNVSFYSESRIQLSNTAPCIYGENSILSFWVYTEQAVDLKVAYRDYSNTAGKSVQCKEMTISIPIGESIVKIPMKDCVPADNDMDYRFAYQLQISVLANDDSYKNSGDILFDAFGFYDSELVINDKPLTMPENTFVWWNFDNGDTLEEIPDEWTARWAGEEGKGIIVTLEKDSDNVYGSKGNSLKIDYVRALGEYTAPNIWLEKRTATMGDGIVFWIKSEQKTNIRILCLDANVDAIEMLVPVTIGYNIVEVKWSDFTYTDKTKTGKPATNSIAQLQLRPMGASGTFWLDQIGFLNVKNDGSNAYNSVYPPTSYKDWEDGNVSGGDGFDNWPSDDDFGFCTEWYFQDTGWITLPKIGNNTVLKMDYNRTNGKRSELVNITEFKDIDPKGGISFWAKSTEARYYTLRISIGTQIIAVNFMGDTNGRTYNIPFSAFWINGRIDKDYIPSSTKGVSVTKLQFVSDETCNPPATGALSDKFSLYLDDIKFVDSLGFLRAADIDYTENGVTLKAAMNAFSVGVIPKITKTELTDTEKQEYLKLAETATDVIALYNIVASDKDGKVQIPTAAVELIFDVPEGIDANAVQVYQVYLDGSLSKRPVTVTEDGRVSTSVFRLGEYLLAWGEVTSKPQVEDDTPVDTPEQPTQESGFWWLIAIIAAVILAGAVVVVVFVRKGRGK